MKKTRVTMFVYELELTLRVLKGFRIANDFIKDDNIVMPLIAKLETNLELLRKAEQVSSTSATGGES